ncbi:MAG: ACR3 family arsenite efflux transporter [Candidatus Nanopelagicales bacterium]|jgi:arsenite transporter|nr:ACR3 family arsenite efflux transporter [Actinomycetota bacterium]NCG03610.1 ACR3 family arsenite efflux transporter [Actinomycetales bacterium]MBT5183445.1 ACR3 family arsenite efflux transporter [Actinomycetota bacterium]MBT5501404.1 ACR3 family arsenite efflux transporter [Actinomycetota bacterium]MDA9017201.1 ACR3 family arsenite efflux transporter [Actinomycetota bacterium]
MNINLHENRSEQEAFGKITTLDRYLPLWIAIAMALGLILGRTIPGLQNTLDSVKIDGTSLLIAIGLFAMMYPVLARVKYEEMGHLTGDRKMLWLSLVLNWVVGPLFMFALAWIFLADQPAFRTGLIVIGLARCIAMVLMWNDLACGDREAGALLVAINSIFQILAYALLGTFYLAILPGWLGLDTQDIAFSTWEITKAVLIFLGIPLALGIFTRQVGVARKGRDWYDNKFAPRIAPIALCGLLFTIIVLFALQGEAITSDPLSVVLIAIPLIIYFAIMWFTAMGAAHVIGLPYARSATVAFTSAGNNFELAIAVSIGVWGVNSGQALTGVIGPLIEVPALVALVYVSLWLRNKWTWSNR